MIDEKLRRILDDEKLRMMLKEVSPQQEIARLRAEIARLRLTDEETNHATRRRNAVRCIRWFCDHGTRTV